MTDIVGVFDATQKAATYIPPMNALAEALNAGNFILNGGFSINQEAPASNADDTYAHDGWYVLTSEYCTKIYGARKPPLFPAP